MAVLTAMALGVILMIPVWNSAMTLSMPDCTFPLAPIPMRINLCRIERLLLSLMTPSMPTSPPSRPAIRLRGSWLMPTMTATWSILGPLAGFIVSDLTPKLWWSNNLETCVSMFGPPLISMDSARWATSFFAFRLV